MPLWQSSLLVGCGCLMVSIFASEIICISWNWGKLEYVVTVGKLEGNSGKGDQDKIR